MTREQIIEKLEAIGIEAANRGDHTRWHRAYRQIYRMKGLSR